MSRRLGRQCRAWCRGGMLLIMRGGGAETEALTVRDVLKVWVSWVGWSGTTRIVCLHWLVVFAVQLPTPSLLLFVSSTAKQPTCLCSAAISLRFNTIFSAANRCIVLAALDKGRSEMGEAGEITALNGGRGKVGEAGGQIE